MGNGVIVFVWGVVILCEFVLDSACVYVWMRIRIWVLVFSFVWDSDFVCV